MNFAEDFSISQLRDMALIDASERAMKLTVSDPLWWLRNRTRTSDQQWRENGKAGAFNPFPDHEYLDVLFDFLTVRPKLIPITNTKVRLVVKARKLMWSWGVMGKLTHLGQTQDEQEIVVQSKEESMGCYLVDYAKMLWQNQPDYLKLKFPLKRGMRIDDFAKDTLEWANGSKIIAIPQGEAKLNTLHPTIHFMDEAAFHAEGLGAFNSAMAAASFVITVSSAWPGWYHDLVIEDRFPKNATKVMRGVALTETRRGAPVLWFDCSAHPQQDAAWEEREKPNYTSDSEFARQQHCDFTAGGGERVLRDRLDARWDDIVITDPDWRPHSEWNYVAGLDYGKNHPTAFEVLAKDRDGVLYAVQEHYQAGLDPGEHNGIIRRMKIPCADDPLTIEKISRTWSDPSLFPENVAGEDKFTSIQLLLEKGGTLKMSKARRGMDLLVLDMLLEMWPRTGPIKFRIWCPKPISRLTEGTYQSGCPNLLWELMNLRRKEISPTLLEKKGNPEGLVDNRNDAFDALKYILTAGDIATPQESHDEKWQKRKAVLMGRNPDMNLDSLIIYRGKFEAEQRKREVLSWR